MVTLGALSSLLAQRRLAAVTGSLSRCHRRTPAGTGTAVTTRAVTFRVGRRRRRISPIMVMIMAVIGPGPHTGPGVTAGLRGLQALPASCRR